MLLSDIDSSQTPAILKMASLYVQLCPFCGLTLSTGNQHVFNDAYAEATTPSGGRPVLKKPFLPLRGRR